MRRADMNDFIEKTSVIHNYKYNYSIINYINNRTPINIICPEHGIFQQTPYKHLIGRGCQKCGSEKSSGHNKTNCLEFIDKSSVKHNNKYSYNKFVYVDSNTKGLIVCPEHGEFTQTPRSHLSGSGCPTCGYKIPSNLTRKDINIFKDVGHKIHNNLYNYDDFVYKNSHTSGIIVCPKHGEFKQTPHNHINGKQGCPICKESKGEKIIRNLLKELKLDFEHQKIFKDCISKRNLKFDFYVPLYNLAIEYDGIQHYKPVSIFGGEHGFELTKHRDDIKNRFCEDNKIKLLRISYTTNIDEIKNSIS